MWEVFYLFFCFLLFFSIPLCFRGGGTAKRQSTERRKFRFRLEDVAFD